MSFIDDDMSELLLIESRVRAGVVERREMVSNYNDITGKNSQYSTVQYIQYITLVLVLILVLMLH